MFANLRLASLTALLLTLNFGVAAAPADEIKIAEVKRSGEVDFGKEVLPILRRKCLACHNSTEAESELILETPQAMIKGGSLGAGVVPGKGLESLVLQVAAHQEEPFMPPEDNDVQAEKLTPEELGLLKLWIDQGAKVGSGSSGGPIKWQSLPPGVNPIYATAISSDGQYAAAGRANQIFVFHVPSKREIGRLTDPELAKQLQAGPGVAHLDLVQSLAFSPAGTLLASGGYRTAKVWRRPTDVKLMDYSGVQAASAALAVSPDGKTIALAEASGAVRLFAADQAAPTKSLSGHSAAVTGIAFSADGAKLATASADKTLRVFTLADAKEAHKVELPTEAKSVAWLDDANVAVGAADKIIRVVTLADGKVVRELKGHSQTVDALVAFGDQQLLSSGPDGTVRHWNGKDGKQIRQINHGGAVHAIAVSPDGTRFASAGANNSTKLWDAANGKQLFDLKGNYKLAIDEAAVTRAVALAKRRVDLANADKKAAEDRKKSEEENKKKADEALKKADEDLKKKVEAAKKPVADKEAADKKLEEAKTAVTKADEAKKAKDAVAETAANKLKAEQAKQTAAAAEATKAANALKAAQTTAAASAAAATKANTAADTAKKAADAAQAALTAAETKAKTAADAAAAAAKAAEAKKDDQELATKSQQAKAAADAANAEKTKAQQQLDAATKTLAAAETAKAAAAKKAADDKAKEVAAAAAKTKADAAKTAADKLVADAQKAQTMALAEQKAATDGLNKANAEVKTAEANVKKLEAPAKKAVDEKTAAERTLAAAKRSVERAIAAVDKATKAIPPIDEQIKQLTAAHKAKETELAAAKEKNTQSAKPAHGVAFSRDGKTLAVGGEDQLIHLYDVATGAPLEVLNGFGQVPSNLAFTDATQLVAAGGQAVSRWETQPQWKLERTIGNVADASVLVDRVTALAFSHDGQTLATGGGEPSRSGEIKLWKVADGSLLRELKEPHSDTVFGLEFSREDQYLASCGADRFVKVFQVADGKFVRSFEGHTHHVLGVSWSADSRTLASSGADKVIKIWDFRTGDQKRTISGFAKEVTSIRFVADGVNVVASCGDSRVHVRRTDNGGNVRTLSGPSDFVYAVDTTADGKLFIAGGQDSVVRVWSDNGQVFVNFEPPSEGGDAKDGG